MGASVKVMLSYNYCHFEISRSTDQEVTDKDINEMRKNVQRLADEAVRQYRKAKEIAEIRERVGYQEKRFLAEVSRIEEKPESERTPEEKALLKQYEDEEWQKESDYMYDYDDDDEPDWN